MTFDFLYAAEILPILLSAAVITVEATLGGFTLALVIGLLVAIARRSRNPVISWPAGSLCEIIRTTPLLIQLYILYFVLPDYGISLSPLATGIIALGVHYGMYLSEVYRAGIENVAPGLREAGMSLGLSTFRVYMLVVIPLAVRTMILPMGNYLISMFKETPLLSAITVTELMLKAKLIASDSFKYVEPMTVVGGIFLVVSLFSSVLIETVEKRFKIVSNVNRRSI